MSTMPFHELIDSVEIYKMVKHISGQISRNCWDNNPLLIGVLKGASRFMMDIVRELSSVSGFKFDYDFITVDSYRGTEQTDKINLTMDIEKFMIHGRHVIIIDDIYDSGATLVWLMDHLASKGPRTIQTCVLLNKNSSNKIYDLKIEYPGFNIEDVFVFGYGMDNDGKYRSLPFIGVGG